MNRLITNLFKPVDIASLVFFRITFGFIMLIEVYRYFSKDWIERYYIEPGFHFKYYGFSWIEPWSGDGMYWHFIALGIVSFLIMVGLFYRLATIAFLFLFSYVFLLDQTQYLNHFYFVILLGGLLCFVPAHHSFSIDSWRKPHIKSETIPFWALLLFILQMEVMYIFAGIVKINPDWLQLQPLTMWLGNATDAAIIGDLYKHQWAIAVGAYGSIILHVLGAPLLLFKRTRLWVFLAYACFHISNHLTFSIGIFPWLTLAGTTLFFDPNWPRKMLEKLGSWLKLNKATTNAYPVALTTTMPLSNKHYVIAGLMTVWLAAQILIPLRHLAYPGNPSWTEEGHRFAWQMKLRSKRGEAEFIMTDPVTKHTQRVEKERYLTRRQIRKMSCRPDMILQFAHHLAETHSMYEKRVKPEVRVIANCSLNGREYQLLIDHNVNLTKVERNLKPATWILPLTTPFRDWYAKVDET